MKKGVKVSDKTTLENMLVLPFRYSLKEFLKKTVYRPLSGVLSLVAQTLSCILQVFDVLKRPSAFSLQYYRRPIYYPSQIL